MDKSTRSDINERIDSPQTECGPAGDATQTPEEATGKKLPTLTDEQRAAVESREPHTLILAVAGAGKTTGLVHRCDELLHRPDIRRVVGISFTVPSATSLGQRAVDHGVDPDRIRVGTFHGIGRALLIRAGIRIEKDAVVKGKELEKVFQQAVVDAGWTGSLAKARDVHRRFQAQVNPSFTAPEAALVEAFIELQRRANRRDFSEMISLCLRGIREGRVPPLDTDHILVDEAQDMDEFQLAFLFEHVRRGVGTTLVGDDDQMIYPFRLALGYAGLQRYKELTGAVELHLSTNFRSRPEIIAAANRLIAHNSNRFEKTSRPAPDAPGGGRLNAHGFKTADLELKAITDAVGGDPARWAILARRNRQLRCIESVLTQRAVPYCIRREDSVWQTPLAGAYLGFLYSLVEPEPGAYLLRGLVSLDVLGDEASTGMRETDLAQSLAFIGGLASRYPITDPRHEALQTFPALWSRWKDALERDGRRPKPVIQAFTAWVSVFIAEDDRPLWRAIGECLDKRRGTLRHRLKVNDFNKAGEEELGDEGVRLITMHGSKGLEFTNVWVYALDSSVDSMSDDLEDERRLAYVAVTRAQHRLVISYEVSQGASRFIAEAGIPAEERPARPRKAASGRRRRRRYR